MSQPQFKPIPFQFTLDLYQALVAARRVQLQPALGQAVSAVGVAAIDADLQRLVPASALTLRVGNDSSQIRQLSLKPGFAPF